MDTKTPLHRTVILAVFARSPDKQAQHDRCAKAADDTRDHDDRRTTHTLRVPHHGKHHASHSFGSQVVVLAWRHRREQQRLGNNPQELTTEAVRSELPTAPEVSQDQQESPARPWTSCRPNAHAPTMPPVSAGRVVANGVHP